MKIYRALIATLLLLGVSSSVVLASAGGGAGVRNGGSGLICSDGSAGVAESVTAPQMGYSMPRIEDRNAFFENVLAKIDNPIFKNLLRRQWVAYGDSVHWPEGELDAFMVYYYVSHLESSAYLYGEMIPARDPQSPLCKNPLLVRELCCDRILISFFADENSQPTKLAKHYNQLGRFDRNVLELHEAAYRAASDFGTVPNPFPNSKNLQDVSDYRRNGQDHGVVPTSLVESVVETLINSSPKSTVSENINRLWDWSNALQTTGSGVPAL